MLVLLSPAKKQDFSISVDDINPPTIPVFINKTLELVAELKKLSVVEIANLMQVSQAIAELNYKRYQEFINTPDNSQACMAIYAFKGDVYKHLRLANYDKQQLIFMQNNFRILSGLYGILRPFDLIQPHRLEMGTNLINRFGNNLYKFWGNDITEAINKASAEQQFILNLASNEYWKSVNKLKLPVFNVLFKEVRNGKLVTIALNAKRARSLMSNYIISHQIDEIEAIKNFNEGGYTFSTGDSSLRQLLFVK